MDEDWRGTFSAALAHACGEWGGVGHIILPLDGEVETRELFWAIASSFDADVYEVPRTSVRDLATASPSQYEAERERLNEHEQFSGYGDDVVEDYLAGVWLTESRMPESLARHIGERLGPLGHHDDASFQSGVDFGYVPGIPVDRLRDLPSTLQLTRSALDPAASLLLMAELGGFIPQTERSLEAAGVDFDSRTVDTDIGLAATLYSSDSQEGVHPWTLSQFKIAPYRPMRDMRRSPVLVVGDDPWDFALFYALRRLHGAAWWVPRRVSESVVLRERLLARVNRFARQLGRPLQLTSASSRDEVERLGREASEAVKVAAIDTVGATSGRWAEGGQIDIPMTVQVRGAETMPVPALFPQDVRARDEWETSWIVEAAVEDWIGVRHHVSTGSSIRGTDPWLTRSTRRGVAWVSSPSSQVAGQPLQSSVVRPSIALPSLLEQVSPILEAALGWSARLSDKGAYAQRAAELFGGIRALASKLQEPGLQSLLFAFMSGKKQEAAPGRWLSGESRRVLSLVDLHSLKGVDPVHVIHWHGAGVLQIGTVLKCVRCRQEAWYDVEVFGRAFICARCRLSQDAGPENWRSPEPQWAYRLDEGLLQFAVHRGDLPLQGLLSALEGRNETLITSFETDIITGSSERDSEIDVLACTEGEVLVGEATHMSRLCANGSQEKARIRRVGAIAEALGARRALFITATTWSERTRQNISSAFHGSWPTATLIEDCRQLPRPSKAIADPE